MTDGRLRRGAGRGGLDPLSVEHVAPLVAYLASPAAEPISGQVFVVYGGMVALMAAADGRAALRRPPWHAVVDARRPRPDRRRVLRRPRPRPHVRRPRTCSALS